MRYAVFSVSQLKPYREESQKKELRCEDCHVCPTCNRKLDAHRFEGKGRVCRTCNEKDKCSTCKRMLSKAAFSASQWHNRRDETRRQSLRCEECHVCKSCLKKQTSFMFQGVGQECRSCHAQNRPHRCDACQLTFAAKHFDRNALKNALRKNLRLVCFQCREKGYTPRDLQIYRCHFCGHRGSSKFTQEDKQKARRESEIAFACTDCVKRKREIESKLFKQDAFRCTCPGVAKKTRIHIASNEKCELFPRRFGEQRWAGSNVGVTRADLVFLQEIKTMETRKRKH